MIVQVSMNRLRWTASKLVLSWERTPDGGYRAMLSFIDRQTGAMLNEGIPADRIMSLKVCPCVVCVCRVVTQDARMRFAVFHSQGYIHA
jgi:hypothetical protein